MFRLSYLVVILVGILPLIPGLSGVILSSFNYIPSLGFTQPSWLGYVQLVTWSGWQQSLLISLFSALFSTYLAAFFCFAVLQQLWGRKYWHKVETLLSPLLAMPHVAFAIGFAFLFAPTGMFARVASQWFDITANSANTTWLVNDPYALGLTLALALKEIPFLLLMSIPVLQQLNLQRSQQVAYSLGYSTQQTWLKLIFPQWLAKMRFALFAVIAYGVSVVDLALILGPTNPPTLAVLVWQWFNDPDLALMPRASAGAVVLFLLASGLMLMVIGIEKSLTQWWKAWQFSGRFGWRLPGLAIFSISALLAALIFPLLLLWSFTHRWRFPDLLPSRFSDRFWQLEWANMAPTLTNSLVLALVSASFALLLALIAHEYKTQHNRHIPDYVIALPMLLPQLSLLFGLQVASLYLSSERYFLWVIWSHVFFAFPFVYLALDGPWKSYNLNLSKTALSLGKSPLRVFIQIKLQLLLPAIFYAWAVGASVSLAQYLPTLMLGAGRIATITTEAVALSSGFDRRVTAIYALWQAVLPFVFFSMAILLGRLTLRRKIGQSKEYRIHDTFARKPRHL
ncbi:thiamine ABC transporter permease [Vibrio scophthalmi]|uniref:ABC transporter permease n=1 Tax=Vibrio scophthalmi TaxID=45658 RepID=UPI002284AB8E|nr:thiamine ABC transporter permease [Vibrio scophthalmi]MCY9803903.1 thiamine ABC transporter permease [Vibrio scophthalmi]